MELRRGLPPLPQQFKHLPLDERGYPIPWFVAEVDGKRDFRVVDGRKRVLAVKERRCWLCGLGMGELMYFVIGPMCAVNRNTSEPGCHRDCALFAVQACPFLTRPRAQYREADLPEGSTFSPTGLPGNPGVTCVWATKRCRPYESGVGDDWLIRLGEPLEVLWYTEGHLATRAQVLEAMQARLPLLRDMAVQEGPEAEAHLDELVRVAEQYLPSALAA